MWKLIIDMKVFLYFKERSPEDLECIHFPETGSYPNGIGGGLIDGLKQIEQGMLSKIPKITVYLQMSYLGNGCYGEYHRDLVLLLLMKTLTSKTPARQARLPDS